MTLRLSRVAAVTFTIALLFVLLQLAADRAGLTSHALPSAGANLLAWGGAFLAGWTLMIVAMTLPSLTPFIRAAGDVGGAPTAVAAAVGVIAVWVAVGILFWALLFASGGSLASVRPDRVEAVAAASLFAAAAYQVSPIARACQRLCAQPFPILARHWRGGASRYKAAALAGFDYGMSCVGCCLPMIVVMFLVGMSDVRWTFAMGAIMIVQKQPVWGARLAWPSAALLAAAGGAISLGWWRPSLMSLRALCGV